MDAHHAQPTHTVMELFRAKMDQRIALNAITRWGTVCNVRLDMKFSLMDHAMSVHKEHTVLDSLACQAAKFPIVLNTGQRRTSARNAKAI